MKISKFIDNNKKSLILAPMDGVTDLPFRMTIQKVFGGWDYFYTDFYRIPSSGRIKSKCIEKFFGLDQKLFNDSIFQYTAFQLLPSVNSQIETISEILEDGPFEWVDLNLGCPSKKVNKNGGGAFLLNNISIISKMIKKFRKFFSKFLTVKMRIGYEDDSNFYNIIRILEEEGINGIVIHGRTKEQMYNGSANWNYFSIAKKLTSLPIIGNGDIKSTLDINNIFISHTPDGAMIGREALRSPWIASAYKNTQKMAINRAWIKEKLIIFLQTYEKYMITCKYKEMAIISRMKFLIQTMLRNHLNDDWTYLLKINNPKALLHGFERHLNPQKK